MTPDPDDIVLDACPPHEATHGLYETNLAALLDDPVADGLARAEELYRQGALSPAYVAAEYAAAGQPLDDIKLSLLYGMGQRDLLDEIAYLADYQG
jgi:hypothetical protein